MIITNKKDFPLKQIDTASVAVAVAVATTAMLSGFNFKSD